MCPLGLQHVLEVVDRLPEFDHDALRLRLEAMNARQRLVFAVLCYFAVERHYRAFVVATGWGNAEQMRQWAERLWSIAAGDTVLNVDELRAVQEQWDALVPDHDDFDSLLTSAALDAAVVLVCATDVAASGSAQEALNAGAQVVALADLLAQESEDMHPQDAQLEEKILAHPLMQAELRRQADVLAVLEAGTELTATSLASLRQRTTTV